MSDIDVEGAEEAVQLNQPAPPAALTGTQIWPGAGSKGAESGKKENFTNILDIWVKLKPFAQLIVT